MANLIFIFLFLFNLILPINNNNNIDYKNELEKYNIIFTGNWSETNLFYVYSGIELVGNKILDYSDIQGNSIDAFVWAYNITKRNPFKIEYYGTGKVGGIASSSNRIGFSGFYRNYYSLCEDIELSSINLVIHELGHAFEYLVDEELEVVELIPYMVLIDTIKNTYFPTRDGTNNNFGFCGIRWDYQQSPSIHPREEFADMFIGWVYDCWEDSEDGKLRSEFMDIHMSVWLILVIKEHFYHKSYTFGSRYFVY